MSKKVLRSDILLEVKKQNSGEKCALNDGNFITIFFPVFIADSINLSFPLSLTSEEAHPPGKWNGAAWAWKNEMLHLRWVGSFTLHIVMQSFESDLQKELQSC